MEVNLTFDVAEFVSFAYENYRNQIGIKTIIRAKVASHRISIITIKMLRYNDVDIAVDRG